MLFTRVGWAIAMIVGLYGVLDLVWTIGVQYAAFHDLDLEGSSAWGRAATEVGLLDDIGDALRLIGFAVALGVLAEISASVAANRSA